MVIVRFFLLVIYIFDIGGYFIIFKLFFLSKIDIIDYYLFIVFMIFFRF